jgi:hypothetical protein
VSVVFAKESPLPLILQLSNVSLDAVIGNMKTIAYLDLLARHKWNQLPLETIFGIKNYARWVRDIQNTTIQWDIDRRYAAIGALTIGNTTIQNGAKADFVSDNSITINGGTTIENGTKVNFIVY